MANYLLFAVIFVALQYVDAKLCTVTAQGYDRTDYCAYGCCYTLTSMCCSKPFYLHSWFIVSFVGTAASILFFIIAIIVTTARRRRQEAMASAQHPVFVAGQPGSPPAAAPNGQLASGNLSFISTTMYPVQLGGGDTPMQTAQFTGRLNTPMDNPPAYTEEAAAPPPFEYRNIRCGDALTSKAALP